MSVVIETTLGDITVDLYTKDRPQACINFLKLCKMKYYNYNLFHTVSRDFIAQTGDPTGSRKGGESVYGVLEGSLKRYFEAETHPPIKHTIMGLISFVGIEEKMIGSQFFITLATDLTYLDDKHCVFGEVVEGFEVLEFLNDAICDTDNRPYQDIRITHTIILDDPYSDLNGLRIPERSPSPNAERLQGGRIAPDEEIDETVGKDTHEIEEIKAEREAKARATILEMVGDIPDAEMAPPENVLFVCKLNPVTTDDDLEIIFSRFGTIKSCEVIRDRKTGDSLQYAFIEFENEKSCEDAYFKMDNVLIDDRRIHVDFSQSVAKVKWLGKGRGVAHYDDKGRKTVDKKNDIGQGNYRSKKIASKGRRSKYDRRKSPSQRDREDKDRRKSSKNDVDGFSQHRSNRESSPDYNRPNRNIKDYKDKSSSSCRYSRREDYKDKKYSNNRRSYYSNKISKDTVEKERDRYETDKKIKSSKHSKHSSPYRSKSEEGEKYTKLHKSKKHWLRKKSDSDNSSEEDKLKKKSSRKRKHSSSSSSS